MTFPHRIPIFTIAFSPMLSSGIRK